MQDGQARFDFAVLDSPAAVPDAPAALAGEPPGAAPPAWVRRLKYALPTEVVPHDRRKDVNEKLLYLIETGKADAFGVTPEDIYQAYTGDGGLHGLQRSDFAHYHAFSEAKKSVEAGQFFTPGALTAFVIDCLRPSADDLIADLTAGKGDFLNPLPRLENVYANELDVKAVRVLKHLFPEAHVTAGDIRLYEPPVQFDLVVGNPPFNLRWRVGDEEWLSQLYYCIKAHDLLKPAGLMALIVPSSFLADEFMDGGAVREINTRFRFLYQAHLPANAFAHLGVTDFATKLMIFQKHSDNLLDDRPYRAADIETVAPDEAAAERIYRTVVAPVLQERERIRPQLYLEMNRRLLENKAFHDKVSKLLFDIRRHPRLRAQYVRCQELLHQYNTQKRPEGMKAEEWEQTRLTEEKVLAFLRSALREQHARPPVPGPRLVKTQYGLRQEQDEQTIRYRPFYELVRTGEYPFLDRTYARLVQRKIREFENQSQPFAAMAPDPQIGRFLDDLVIQDTALEREIRLKPLQRADTNLILQKRYAYLQWEQGSGKSISATAQLLYRLKHRQVHNVFVVGTAIAVRNTWAEIMPSYGIAHRLVDRLADVAAIRPGEVALITLEMLTKYQRALKRLVRRLGQDVFLILDEGDATSSSTSRRTKAVLNVFRRARFKTVMSGTAARNNISEFYPSLELLYNNSVMSSANSSCHEQIKAVTRELKLSLLFWGALASLSSPTFDAKSGRLAGGEAGSEKGEP